MATRKQLKAAILGRVKQQSPRLKQLSVRRHSGEIMASPVIIAARPRRGSTRPVDGERSIG
jgi:hypothetical protein